MPGSGSSPLWMRAFNRLDGSLTALNLVPRDFTVAEELALASRTAGLDDFGDEHFLAPLGRLLEAYNQDAALNLIGRLSVRTYLQQLLTSRLYLQADRERHPGTAAEKISRPLFIIGLPRTGSTLLFELLAQDASLRTAASWQVMFPSDKQGSVASRQKRAQRTLGVVDWISPGFRRIHQLGALLPQECIAIQTHSFRSIQFHTSHRVTGYHHWMLQEGDWEPAYREHRQFLQQLAHQFPLPGRNWLLKAPGHLFSLDALLKTYPDAQLIQTHRDPTEVVPSIANLTLELRRAFSNRVDAHETGREWAEAWNLGLMKTLQARRRDPSLDQAIVDLMFEDFMRDPLACVRDIYRQLDRPLEAATLELMQAYLAAHPRNRFGAHEYALEDFGLSREEELRRFDYYIRNYPTSGRAPADAAGRPV